MSSSRGSGAVGLLVRVAVFSLVFAALGEVWFRTAMPASETPLQRQVQPAALMCFDPSGPRDGLTTDGRFCVPSGAWHINNAGWNSAVDYLPAASRGRPMVALLGDSFIEGFATDVDQHVDAYLARDLPGTASYAFGESGWYLAQYLAVARYAKLAFGPDVIVVFLDIGDVSDSLRENGEIDPYWWQIGRREGTYVELPPTAAYGAPSLKARTAKRSALLDYLRYNCRLSLPGMATVGSSQAMDSAAAAGAAATTTHGDLLPAARFMVRALCAQHPGTPIVFAAYDDFYLAPSQVDSVPLFPDGAAVRSACAGDPQCTFVNLRYAFSRDWAAHHRVFTVSDGWHWNAYGDQVVARELARVIRERGLLQGAAAVTP